LKPANTFKYENRLAKVVSGKGGMSAAEAIRGATAAVELVRDPTIAQIDANLQEIYTLADQLKAGPDEAALQRMYICSNQVVATAGVFDLADLGQAAYSLCELVSRFQTLDRFQWQLIQVHTDGLRLLRTPGEHDPEHRAAVLEGLRRVATSVA